MLDGVCWSIVRPIGAGRQHLAIRDAELSQVALRDDAASGLAPFLDAVVAGLLPGEVATLVPGGNATNAWLVALAWLSRDQECRFDKLLEWRSPDSDSGSPARSLAVQQRQDALRTLIGVVVPEEFELRTELDKLEAGHRNFGQEVTRLEWATNRLRAGLVQELGLDPEALLPGRMAVEPLKAAAKERAWPGWRDSIRMRMPATSMCCDRSPTEHGSASRRCGAVNPRSRNESRKSRSC